MVVTRSAVQGAARRAAGPGCAATIGNFDGVHRGHCALLDRVAAKARELNTGSCVLTFEPHPREFFARAGKGAYPAPARLTRLRDKLDLIADAGIDRVHVARFDARFAALSAAQFVEEVLVREIGVRWLAVGRDFRFGKGRSGDFATLEEAAPRCGFRVEAMPEVLVDGARVSSSEVRAALRNGDLRRAERLLGHPYFISGRVAHGARLGRGLGFPTANIPLWRSPPLSGIFVVEVEKLGPGVASVGRRPTVNPVDRPLLEVHLLDLDRDLYGRRLRVRFLEKLREEEKYAGLRELKAAIARDVDRAQEYFERHG
ncbi:MAG TPA: bifunctional riboflavin kinase/FAD synthetase [Burkholderiales bacterium]|nr:bifunctional riboflavin kinase/FAD synthetase [Burkholderiales bacterium]